MAENEKGQAKGFAFVEFEQEVGAYTFLRYLKMDPD
jgi:RNA recognition motif-containing protein